MTRVFVAMLGALLTIPCAAPRNCFIFHVSITGFFSPLDRGVRVKCCAQVDSESKHQQTVGEQRARREEEAIVYTQTPKAERTNGLVNISFIASQFIMSTLDDKYFLIETKSKIDSRNGSLYDCRATGKITVLRRPLMNSNDRKQ